jgi:hypothetical protein
MSFEILFNNTINPQLTFMILCSRYEQAFVSTMIKDYQANLWIGLNDLHTEGTYSWVGNTPVSYVNWERGKPSYNYYADCVAMKTGKVSLGRWDVQVCSAFQGYICEAGEYSLYSSMNKIYIFSNLHFDRSERI